MIKDSGNRTKFESGAVRDIQEGKGRCDLLPLSVIGYWLVDPIFEMIDLYRNEQTPGDMAHILNKFAEYHEVVHGSQFGEENRLDYRYSLVLEVAKHFEEGAKKYGDRNWEKGIPCYRYIDSAVRHYCKWRAGWTDEPHDRAFIWNMLCCEWTRQRYGWNLEKLGEKSESEEGVKIGEQLARGAQDGIRLNDFEEAKKKDQETINLKAACDVAEHYNACRNMPIDICWNRHCVDCEHNTEPEDITEALNKMANYIKKSEGSKNEN